MLPWQVAEPKYVKKTDFMLHFYVIFFQLIFKYLKYFMILVYYNNPTQTKPSYSCVFVKKTPKTEIQMLVFKCDPGAQNQS